MDFGILPWYQPGCCQLEALNPYIPPPNKMDKLHKLVFTTPCLRFTIFVLKKFTHLSVLTCDINICTTNGKVVVVSIHKLGRSFI